MEEKRRERKNEEMCSQGKKNGRKEKRYALIGEKEWKKRDMKEGTKEGEQRRNALIGEEEYKKWIYMFLQACRLIYMIIQDRR